jgi:hypothetical protein
VGTRRFRERPVVSLSLERVVDDLITDLAG